MLATARLPADASELRNRYETLSTTQARLQGMRMAIAKISESKADKVAKAKGRLLCEDEAADVFQEMQRRAHTRAVEEFEALLSAILHDVLPEEGTVKLDLDIKAGSACLDIGLLKNGHTTDVLEFNGGAVTNVVCAGLKFAALSRTANRKFMVLDEPDCWIKPALVPAFLKVISDVATQVRTQTLIVSHHPADMLGEDITRVQFTANSAGDIQATVLEPVACRWEDDSTPGFRSIELINFMAHKHTVIPCFPGATAFIGDNNLGKSAALVSSFRAVAYNSSSDQCINHDAKSATIVYHLENDQHLIWSRDPSRNPVVLYELYQGDSLVREGRPPARNTAPSWVTDLLGINRVDGLDLQLGSQKLPVFLLDQTSTIRAQLLSIGRESGHLVSLMQSYEELKRADKALVRTGEKELQVLFRQLTSADSLDAVEVEMDSAKKALRNLDAGFVEVGVMLDLERRLAASQLLVMKSERSVEASKYLPLVPVLQDVSILESSIARISLGEACSAIAPVWVELKVPVLQDITRLDEIGKRLAHGYRCEPLEKLLPTAWPLVPVLVEVEELSRVITSLEKVSCSFEAAVAEAAAANAALDRAKTEFDELMHSLGDRCPLCESPLQPQTRHTHA